MARFVGLSEEATRGGFRITWVGIMINKLKIKVMNKEHCHGNRDLIYFTPLFYPLVHFRLNKSSVLSAYLG